MTVQDFLPKVKANKFTYYNLSKLDIAYFKKQYEYLKRHRTAKVTDIAVKRASEALCDKSLILDFLQKSRAMNELANGIVFAHQFI